MKLSEALSEVRKCNPVNLEDYSTLNMIQQRNFYYPSPVSQIDHKTGENGGKFILFSAPGAVGKTSAAQYIAQTYGGFYWNLGASHIGTNCFAGTLTHAIGIGKGVFLDQFFKDLRQGKALIVLDAFDEAALISGFEGVRDFLCEIGKILKDSVSPSIILTARTEMARYIMKICEDQHFEITHYAIDYFEDNVAWDFISQYLNFYGGSKNPQKKTVEEYLDNIRKRLGDDPEVRRAFLGYAQVLTILAEQIRAFYEDASSLGQDMCKSLLSIGSGDSDRLIFDIIQSLLHREEGKLAEFKKKIRASYVEQGKEEIVDHLYCKEEQLIRLNFFAFAGEENIQVDDCESCAGLLPEDRNEYARLLKEWLPQHIFLKDKKIMPVFRDYLFAEALLNPRLEIFANDYYPDYEEHSLRLRLPTRVFMDCYLILNNNCVNSEHVGFLTTAYFSQTGAKQQAFCEISHEYPDSNDIDAGNNLLLTFSDEVEPKKSIQIIRTTADAPISLDRLENISIDVKGKIILGSSRTRNVIIRQASIECDELEFYAPEVTFETCSDHEVNSIIVHRRAMRRSGNRIRLSGNIKVDFPKDERLKQEFYEFKDYYCSFDGNGIGTGTNVLNEEQFVYSLKKVLEQFRSDRHQGDRAKYKEKIDARCQWSGKGRVLEFLKDIGAIYEEGAMYKSSKTKLEELCINYVAYVQFNYEQMKSAYERYVQWEQAITGR